MALRTWGRIPDGQGGLKWVPITTTVDGYDDFVWLTTLVQCLKLNTNESPLYAQYGIPAKQSVLQQIFPDFDVAKTQQQFSQFFASLTVAKIPSRTPTYRINVTTSFGLPLEAVVPV